jgi:pimeloyl-ACP methyl ester carboxylesterase
MATFVLVHGAWEAGWAWKWVSPILRAAGHDVYTPSLTGLGERSHLLNREVDLETHIQDVLGVINWGQLENVTLVGHSSGGMVITGTADRAQNKIGSLIYLDAFLPKNGQALIDLMSSERSASIRQLAEEMGEGWYVPPLPAPAWHVHDPNQAALLDELSTPHPLATMTQKISHSDNHFKIKKKAYVLATGYEPSSFPQFADQAKDMDWPIEELATHHFTMFSMPQETADILMRHAA